eukprot:GEMP01037490.1.p1 GENE.GEMP01037490.1~~GEMP01037490.1.p1  ORF type:complete len:460 (+),score=85.41 GEMP01037490.1:277-1656(+)
MSTATRILLGIFFVGDAAASAIPLLDCHVLGAVPEFPISSDQLSVLRTRKLSLNTGMTLEELPVAKLTRESVGDRDSGFESDSSEYEAAPGTLGPEYFSALGKFPEERGVNSVLANSNLQVTIDLMYHTDEGDVLLRRSPPLLENTYTLKEYVGRGKTGFVYRAVNEEGTDVAIKFTKIQPVDPRRPNFPVDKNALNEEVLHEYKMLQILADHPNVPNAIALGKMQGDMDWCVVMVSEFAGQDLYRMRQEREGIWKLTEEEMYDYGIKLTDALKVLHDNYRMLHRDIKLPNIMVLKAPSGRVEDDKLFLADFGTASSYIQNDGFHMPAMRNRRVGSMTHASTRVLEFKTPARVDDMFSALLSIMEMRQHYSPKEVELRQKSAMARLVTSFDREWPADRKTSRRGWVAPHSTVGFPDLFDELWLQVYIDSELTGPLDEGWTERPQYEYWMQKMKEELEKL